MKQIQSFMAVNMDSAATGLCRNADLTDDSGNLMVYARARRRLLEDKQVVCLDLARVNIFRDYLRGPGRFTAWLTQLELVIKYPYECIYVECVHDDRFGRFLVRQGYTQKCEDDLGVSFSYYKLFKPE